MAIKWNQIDFARKNFLTGEFNYESDPKKWLGFMELAIVDNKPDFIQFLIDNNFNLVNFLTKTRLLFLYNCDKVRNYAIRYFLCSIKNYF